MSFVTRAIMLGGPLLLAAGACYGVWIRKRPIDGQADRKRQDKKFERDVAEFSTKLKDYEQKMNEAYDKAVTHRNHVTGLLARHLKECNRKALADVAVLKASLVDAEKEVQQLRDLVKQLTIAATNP